MSKCHIVGNLVSRLHYSNLVILQSGIGGALFFSVAIVIVILLFPMLSLKLKTRAPGAKTFPQVNPMLLKTQKKNVAPEHF